MSGLDRTMDLLESPGSAQGHASKYAGQSWPWPALQRAHGRRRPDHLRPRLQDGTRRHSVEGQGLDLSFRPIDGLAQVQEASGAGGYGVGLPCPPCNISDNPPRLRATTSSPYGADYAMPNLLNHLAAPSCSRLGSHWDYVEPKGGNHPRRN